MGKLTGRVALVTGASRGIGRTVAELFATEGASVIATARNRKALDQLASTVKASGGYCRCEAFDLGDQEAIDHLVGSIRDEFGRLDILIGNAAIFPGHLAVHEIEPLVLQETMHVNFFSNWYLLRCCHELLRKSDAGRVVFVTSRGAYYGDPGWMAYTASKAALDRVMQNYAVENETNAIRCNSLSPGPVITDMGIFANKGQSPAMVPAEKIMPMFWYLIDPELKETGMMFDYRNYREKGAITPWADFMMPGVGAESVAV